MKNILLFLLCLSITALQAQNYYVYVAAESEDEVYIVQFDGEKATVKESITVGYMPTEIEGPHGITVSPDGKYWYLSMAHGSPYGKVYKYSTATNEILGSAELGLFPASMQISKASGLLYVVNFNLHGKMEPSSVSVVDPEDMVELTKVTTGAMPHGSRISPDGLHQYSVSMMSGELFEINTLDMEVSRKLDLDPAMKEGMAMKKPKMTGMSDMQSTSMNGDMMGAKGKKGMSGGMDMKMHSPTKPTWVIPHPSKEVVFVAGNGSNEVLEVDLNAWEVTHRLASGKGPYNVEITPDGKKMVVTYKSEATTAIWDLASRKELARIENSRKVSHGIAISTDSKYAFISVEGIGIEPGSVDVIDLESMERVAVAEIGKQAGGIAFWKKE